MMAINPYEDEIIDLWKLKFMFAVEALDPRYGRLEFLQVHDGAEFDEKVKTPLTMIECGEGGNNEHFKLKKL